MQASFCQCPFTHLSGKCEESWKKLIRRRCIAVSRKHFVDALSRLQLTCLPTFKTKPFKVLLCTLASILKISFSESTCGAIGRGLSLRQICVDADHMIALLSMQSTVVGSCKQGKQDIYRLETQAGEAGLSLLRICYENRARLDMTTMHCIFFLLEAWWLCQS